MEQHCLVFLYEFSCGFFAVLWQIFHHKINARFSCDEKIPMLLIFKGILTHIVLEAAGRFWMSRIAFFHPQRHV